MTSKKQNSQFISDSFWVPAILQELGWAELKKKGENAYALDLDGAPERLRERFKERVGFVPGATDSAILDAIAVAKFLGGAVGGSPPGSQELLARLAQMVRDAGGTQAKRRAVVRAVEASVSRWRTEPEAERESIGLTLMVMLASIDKVFFSLPREVFRRELSRSNLRGPVRIAAAIAVAAGFDADEDKSRKAFYEAAKSSDPVSK